MEVSKLYSVGKTAPLNGTHLFVHPPWIFAPARPAHQPRPREPTGKIRWRWQRPHRQLSKIYCGTLLRRYRRSPGEWVHRPGKNIKILETRFHCWKRSRLQCVPLRWNQGLQGTNPRTWTRSPWSSWQERFLSWCTWSVGLQSSWAVVGLFMRLAENWKENVLSTVTNRFYECDISLTRQALLPGF